MPPHAVILPRGPHGGRLKMTDTPPPEDLQKALQVAGHQGLTPAEWGKIRSNGRRKLRDLLAKKRREKAVSMLVKIRPQLQQPPTAEQEQQHHEPPAAEEEREHHQQEQELYDFMTGGGLLGWFARLWREAGAEGSASGAPAGGPSSAEQGLARAEQDATTQPSDEERGTATPARGPRPAEPGPALRQRHANRQAADERAASAAPPSRPRPAEPGPAPPQRDASDRPGQPPEFTPGANPAFSPPGTWKRPSENPRWFDMMNEDEEEGLVVSSTRLDTGRACGLLDWPAP